MMQRLAIALILTILTALSAMAQEDSTSRKRVPLLERPFFSRGIIGRAIRAFSDIDSAYCAPNYYNWSTMVSADAQVQPLALHAPDGTRRMAVPTQVSFTPHFGWRWLVYGYSVAKLGSTGHQTTQHLSFYARPLGGDLIYQYNKLGSLRHDGTMMPQSLSSLVTLHAYCIFNHRRFNYSTQQAQGSQQLRSSGSWLLGLRYDHQNLRFDGQHHLYHSIGPTGGYAYNWVFAPGWVLGGGLQAEVGAVTMWRPAYHTGEMRTSAMSGTGIARLGVMWTDNKWFVGANAVSHNYVYSRTRSVATNSLNFFSIYAGIKFGLRSQYKKH